MADQGVSDLIKGISDDVKLLVRDEIQLAKAELVPAAKNAGIGAGLFGAAGYFAICALSVLYFAAAFQNIVKFANGAPSNILNPEVLTAQ